MKHINKKKKFLMLKIKINYRFFNFFLLQQFNNRYEDNIDCLLYTFIAQPDHIVEITFDEFDVQKSLEITTSTKTKTTSHCDYQFWPNRSNEGKRIKHNEW